jgi:hypothetical protein
MERRPIGDQLRYVSKVLQLGNIDYLVDELARRQAFFKLWSADYSEPRPEYLSLSIADVRKRHQQTWKEIRKSFDPVPRSRWQSSSPEDLAKRFKARLFGLYYKKEDGALKDSMGGMPSLMVSF